MVAPVVVAAAKKAAAAKAPSPDGPGPRRRSSLLWWVLAGTGGFAAMGLLPIFILGGMGSPPPELLNRQVKPGSGSPSDFARGDIPPEMLEIYQKAAATCPGLSWSILAAIGSIETNHGRSTLPGVHSGENFAGAGGPMQFLQGTWDAYGVDGDGDGDKDRYDPTDAVFGAANYLCSNGAGDPERLRSAIWNYNHSDQYVQDVLDLAARYSASPTGGAVLTGNGSGGACPVPVPPADVQNNWGDPRSGGRSHKGNDIGAPDGTPVVAVADGSTFNVNNADTGLGGIGLWIRDDSGNSYYYAHNSSNTVSEGQQVRRGDVVGYVGSSGNADPSYPHLHFQIHPGGGEPTDPWPILTAWGCTSESGR